MKKMIRSLFILIIAVGFLLSGWFVLEIFYPVKLADNSLFIIKPREGVNQISSNLKKQGIIKSSLVFETYAYLKDVEGRFREGEYSLPSVINIKRLIDLLIAGESTKNLTLLIKEGYTIKDIDAALSDKGSFSAGVFEAALANLNQDFLSAYDFLSDKPASAPLEGYLFPDTYYFFSYSTPEDIIRKILANFNSKFTDELKTEIKNQDKTVFDVIIMASIIEREAKVDPQNPDEDANLIAGIFWKRLEAGMPLQADSTVEYLIGREPNSDDLKKDSPFNTYLYPGLPPHPICNPSISAIKAAVYPEESDYWFFLTAHNTDGTVSYHYAKDFAEHQENIEAYLRK